MIASDTTPQSPSLQSIQRSPAAALKVSVSTSGEISTSPNTRIRTLLRGCVSASSAVIRPVSTRRCTKVWSVVTCETLPSLTM